MKKSSQNFVFWCQITTEINSKNETVGSKQRKAWMGCFSRDDVVATRRSHRVLILNVRTSPRGPNHPPIKAQVTQDGKNQAPSGARDNDRRPRIIE